VYFGVHPLPFSFPCCEGIYGAHHLVPVYQSNGVRSINKAGAFAPLQFADVAVILLKMPQEGR
jgi:hypothetical protein